MPKNIINSPDNATKPTFVKGLSKITSNAPNAIGNAMQSKLIVANVLLLIYIYILSNWGLYC